MLKTKAVIMGQHSYLVDSAKGELIQSDKFEMIRGFWRRHSLINSYKGRRGVQASRRFLSRMGFTFN